jgi:hypothetical protein
MARVILMAGSAHATGHITTRLAVSAKVQRRKTCPFQWQSLLTKQQSNWAKEGQKDGWYSTRPLRTKVQVAKMAAQPFADRWIAV